MIIMNLHVYLNFQGQAEAAVLFYAKAFGSETPKILKFGDMPANPNFPPLSEDAKNLVMHTQLNIGTQTIKISDTLPNMPFTQGSATQIAIELSSESEFDSIYSVLQEDAKIIVPAGPSFFATKYVYFTDKFGTLWHLMVQQNH